MRKLILTIILSTLQGWRCIGQQQQLADNSGQASSTNAAPPGTTMDLLMPSVRPQEEDEYFCTAKKLPDTQQYITSFRALAEASRAHHILIYGCDEPFSSKAYWHCGSMCRSGSPRILFAWAKNAQPTQLPKDVAFDVGPGTGAQYLILQIHYTKPLSESDPGDTSGIRLTLSDQPPRYIAGILLFVAYEVNIPPHTPKVHGDITCQYTGNTVLYPFAFRVHAHTLGKVIAAYHNNGSWYIIGKGNPQWPQAFYPITQQHSIQPQENLAARCTYDASNRQDSTKIGGKHNDEMCNFYMMYYTDFQHGKSFVECAGNQFPDLIRSLPPGSDIPLPPNPALEEQARGHEHHHTDDQPETQPNPSQPAYGNQPRSGRYQDLTNINRFVNRPYDQYDYYNLGGGGGDDNLGGRDYFYDEVANQRSRNRHPTMGRFDNDNDDGAGAFFGFNDDDDTYYNPQGQAKGGGQTMSDQERMNAYDLIKQQAPQTLSHGSHAESMHHPNPQPQPSAPTPRQRNTAFLPKISAKKGPMRARPAPQPTQQVVTASPRTAPPPTHKTTANTLLNSNPKPSMIEEVPNWPTILESDHVTLGQVTGVAVDSQDNLFVFHRGSRVWDQNSFTSTDQFKTPEAGAVTENVILQFDQLGELKDQWGKNTFFMPHGIHIDEKDNLWLTDVAMHQVFMYKKGEKTPSLTLGTRMVPGSDSNHFCKPTDVATSKSGYVFIADGYCNARIMKFTPEGKFIKQWGEMTAHITHNGSPPVGTFIVPHSITVLDDLAWVCVADRENGRIQCFDFDGKFIKSIHLEGFHSKLFAISYSEKQKVIYAINGHDSLQSAPVQGFVISPDSGSLITTFMPSDPGFRTPHDICVNNKGDQVYVSGIGPNKIWDFKVHQEKLSEKILLVKKTRPGVSVSNEVDKSEGNIKDLDDVPGDFGASIVIGLLLVVPIIIIVSITVFLRLKKKGKIPFLANYNNRNRRFNLGDFFSRHNGFDKVKTEEGDELDPLHSDSDVEEYSATAQKA